MIFYIEIEKVWYYLPVFSTPEGQKIISTIDKCSIVNLKLAMKQWGLLRNGIGPEGGWTRANLDWHFLRVIAVKDGSEPNSTKKEFEEFSDDDTSAICGFVDDFTPSANLYAKIATVGTNKKLHIYDNDLDEQIDIILPLAIPIKYTNPSPLNAFSFKLTPVIGADATCNSYYILLDHAGDEWLYIKVPHVNGGIKYSFDNVTYSDFPGSPLLSLGTEYTVSILLTAVNKFKLSLGGAYSAEITNDNTYDTSIDSFQILTETVNEVAVAATGQEDFEPYDVGDAIIGESGPIGDWSDNGGSGSYTAKIAAGQVLECIDDTAGEYFWPKLTFDSVGHVGDRISVDWKNSANNAGQMIIIGDGGSYIQIAYFNGDGKLRYYDTAHSLEDTGLTWSINTWYTIWIKFESTTQFKIYIGAQGCAEPSWAGIGALDCNDHLTEHVTAISWIGSGSQSTTTTIDNIRPSWMYVAASSTPTPIEAYIDDISHYYIDPINVFGMFHVIGVRHAENFPTIVLEQVHGQFIREHIKLLTNAVTVDGDSSFLIAEFIDANSQIRLTDSGGNAVTFSDDEHNGRGCRIVARETERVVCIVASDSDITPDNTAGFAQYSENYVKLSDESMGGFSGVHIATSGKATAAEADCMIELLVTVPRTPCKENNMNVKISIYSQYTSDAVSYTMTNFPYLELYNYDTSAWVRVQTFSRSQLNPAGYLCEFSMKTENMDKFYDPATMKMKFQLYTGVLRQVSDSKYMLYWDLYEFTVEVDCYGESDPKEYFIEGTANDDELTLTIDDGVYDTFVNRHSIGDTVIILNTNEEFLETVIAPSALNLDAIQCPAGSGATYTELLDKKVAEMLNDIMEWESWYYRVTRKTYNGKPRMKFEDKASIPDKLLVIKKDCIIGPIETYYNALEIMRQVVLKNKTSSQEYPTPDVLSNYPRQVVSRQDVPDSYLLDGATSLSGQYDEVSGDYPLKIDFVYVDGVKTSIFDADPEEFDIGIGVDLEDLCESARGAGDGCLDETLLVIREIVWQRNWCTVSLGFNNSQNKSPQERMMEYIARTRYENTL